MNFTKDFESILVDFFKKYDEKNLKTVPEIMKRFRQNKVDVMLHLCDKYKVNINSIEGIDMSGAPAPKQSDTSESDASIGTENTKSVEDNEVDGDDVIPKKKGKKKLMLIILIVIILAGSGGAGYMFMFGGGDESVPAEEMEQTESAETEVEEPEQSSEPEPDPEPVTDTSTSDSTVVDSLKVEEASDEADTQE